MHRYVTGSRGFPTSHCCDRINLCISAKMGQQSMSDGIVALHYSNVAVGTLESCISATPARGAAHLVETMDLSEAQTIWRKQWKLLSCGEVARAECDWLIALGSPL